MSGPAWSHPGYEAVAQFLGVRTGLEFSPNRFGNAEAGIRRAMARAGASDVSEYLRLLQGDHIADDDLITELTVGETYFFRDPAHFAFVRDTILPELPRWQGATHTLRAWSAGCATGEEAYSLAILLTEQGLAHRAQILASDLSCSALRRARAGVYRQWSLRAMEESLRARYFLPRDDRWELMEPIRRQVHFEHLNLAHPNYPSLGSGVWGMDLIFCRNVLIYFSPDAVRAVGTRLIASLREGGWLIAGPADPPLGDVEGCEAVVTPEGVYYRREERVRHGQRQGRATAALASAMPAPPQAPARPAPASASPPPARLPDPSVRTAELVRPAGRMEQARKAMGDGDYRHVVALTGGLAVDAEACALRARALANLGQPERALGDVRDTLRSQPLVAELQLLRALLCMECGALAEAAQAVRRVLYLDRSLAIAHFTLGTILQRIGDVPGARRAYRNALAQSAAQPHDAPLPLGEGAVAGWLAEAATAHLALLEPEP
jgi:chemotaxis protein methyltransferase CheR